MACKAAPNSKFWEGEAASRLSARDVARVLPESRARSRLTHPSGVVNVVGMIAADDLISSRCLQLEKLLAGSNSVQVLIQNVARGSSDIRIKTRYCVVVRVGQGDNSLLKWI